MEDIGATARQYLDFVNARDWDAMRSVMHSGYTYTGGDGVRREGGPDVGVAVSQGFIAAMSDAHINADRAFVAGNTVVLECTGTGTHDGNFGPHQASGARVRLPVCIVLDFNEGKIVAEREYMDMACLLQLMGVMPAPATA
jgi:ketosteroid isomerase-like protein